MPKSVPEPLRFSFHSQGFLIGHPEFHFLTSGRVLSTFSSATRSLNLESQALERKREGEREKERETEGKRERETERKKETERKRERQTERKRDRKKERKKEREKER